MPCDCHIEITEASQKGVLLKLLGLNATMFVIELVAGIAGESTGVLADSLDMLADALVYSVALYAVGRCASIKSRAAFFSGAFQVIIALSIFSDIIRRVVYGSDPSSLLMFSVSIVALIVNTYCLRLISKEKEGEAHMRASYIFSKNDVIANSGVILASFLIYLTNSRWPDIIIGFIITVIVFLGGLKIISSTKGHTDSERLNVT
ncbi:MAG: cation transporter [Verrucomicrobiae bacterium]|nr:cation transporter [Verrucomicrobiae bacterium]NNJ42679.1 cation transporter [Akkermansiaceae bacterium]